MVKLPGPMIRCDAKFRAWSVSAPRANVLLVVGRPRRFVAFLLNEVSEKRREIRNEVSENFAEICSEICPEIFGAFLAGRKVLPPNFTRNFTSDISNFKSKLTKKLHNALCRRGNPKDSVHRVTKN